MYQMDLLNAADLRDLGMNQALENADRQITKWSEMAMKHLLSFLAFQGSASFLAEDVRRFAKAGGLEDSPSNRAWGGVIVRAATMGLIKRVGHKNTSNPKAHSAIATLWCSTNGING